MVAPASLIVCQTQLGEGMSVVESGRLGDRLSVDSAPHPMGAKTLYLTIGYFGDGTVYLTVYRLRTISGSRRGWFDVVELSLSCTSSVSELGRPISLPRGTYSRGRGRELIDVVNWLSSHAPCASRVNSGRTAL